jgi:type IV pilus assembly protein PilM
MSFLHKKIFSFWDSPFGVDLSDLSVKVLQLEKEGKKEKVVSYGMANIPIGSISDGEIIKKENVVSAIREAIKKSGPKRIRTRNIVCSLPETKAFLRIINIPKMEEKEAKEAIKWEIEANIPISIDQVYYDWQILDRSFESKKDKMSVLVVAVSQKIVDQFIDIMEAAGLTVIGMEIESIAQTHSLLSEKGEEKTVLVIDSGDRRTSFSISIGSIPCFTSSIPLSSQTITDSIAKSFNLPFEEAEKIKLTNGIGSYIKNDPLFLATKPVLENLVTETEKFIDFYLTGLKYSSSIDKIIMCGGGANTKGIITYLSMKLKREIEIGDPWINFNLEKELPLIDRKKSIQYSTVIGLALKGLYENIS